MRRSAAVLVVGVSVVLAGCSTTVVGSPVADPSGLPKPEVGMFATAPRTISPITQGVGEMLEGHRMAAVMPYLYEMDPALHFRGQLAAGSAKGGASSVKNVFGDAADRQITPSAEIMATTGARDQQQGTRIDATTRFRSATISVVRMASPQAAAAAVNPALLADDPGLYGTPSPKKASISIPGYGAAVAYTQTYEKVGTSTSAFLAHQRYVLAVTGDLNPEQIRTFFDKQIKGLEGFAPTAPDKVTTLPLDESGVAKLTLAPQTDSGSAAGTAGYSLPPRTMQLRQTDVSRSVKTFADAGVDVIAAGGNTVYRARDAKGAQYIVDEFLAETRDAYPGVESETVKGVPGGTCLTFATYPGSTSKVTMCLAAVGRYVAEYSSGQRIQAVQATGAAYLILKKQT
jgi:hypothetical protein